jgi:hypothetical protein
MLLTFQQSAKLQVFVDVNQVVFNLDWPLMSQQKSPRVRKRVHMLGVTSDFECLKNFWISIQYEDKGIGFHSGFSMQCPEAKRVETVTVGAPSVTCSANGFAYLLYWHVLGVQDDVVWYRRIIKKENRNGKALEFELITTDASGIDFIRSQSLQIEGEFGENVHCSELHWLGKDKVLHSQY